VRVKEGLEMRVRTTVLTVLIPLSVARWAPAGEDARGVREATAEERQAIEKALGSLTTASTSTPSACCAS
jgi:hypothetical protein